MSTRNEKGHSTERFTGVFYKSLFRSGDGGKRCVYQYSDGERIATVVGDDLPDLCLSVTFYGRWKVTSRGKQFSAKMAVCNLPKEKEQIVRFISSLKLGIPTQWASKMVASVGAEHFWDELNTDPMQFCAIQGVIPESITALQLQAAKIASQEHLFELFGDELICNGSQYKQICKAYDNDLDAVAKAVEYDPFCLLKHGFDFATLDSYCANHTVFPVNDYRRLLAATHQALLKAKTQSHVGLPHETLVSAIQTLTKKQGAVSQEDICIFLCNAEEANDIVFSGSLYYLPRAFKEESAIADIMVSLLCKEDDTVDDSEFERVMADYAKEKGFQLSPDQQNAVRTAIEKSIVVITGGPGTGKSTILDAILTCWKHFHDDNWLLMAPTGKAAVRMTETTGQPATTIHASLGLSVGNEDPEKLDAAADLIDASLIVVDESSMIDQTVMAAIARALSQDETKVQHLILVGDPQQLPSVGWGNILGDFISSEAIPVCRLNTIYRQGAGNPIITNSAKMQAGDTQLEWTSAFKRYYEGDDEANKSCACRLYQRCVAQFGIENVAMLSPYHHATAISTDSLNQMLQEMLNPNRGQGEITFMGNRFRQGDRVMQLRNTDGLSNGDIGTIVHIAESAKETDPCVYVRFENGTETEYIRDDLGQLELAYAISIHKSQGSQYKTVIIVLPNHPTVFLKRNILYTAITRSSMNIAIISPTSTIEYCIQNEQRDERYTNLAARLHNSVYAVVQEEYPARMESLGEAVLAPSNVEFVFEPDEASYDDFDF